MRSQFIDDSPCGADADGPIASRSATGVPRQKLHIVNDLSYVYARRLQLATTAMELRRVLVGQPMLGVAGQAVKTSPLSRIARYVFASAVAGGGAVFGR